MYEYGTETDLSKDAKDELARITLSRFRAAVLWQGSESVGGKSLRMVMQECYDQYNGILACEDREAAEALGVSASVNLTAMKVNVVRSFLRETLVQPDSLPWTVAPTPIPTLSDNARYEALEEVKSQIFTMGFQGDLIQLVSEVKGRIKTQEIETAKKAARNMEKLMLDQSIEGKWGLAMSAGLTEFPVYPFAVLHGPVPTRAPRLTWAGNKPSVKYETFYQFECPSVWDFWYSPDSTTAQNGTGVFLRQRWNRQKLYDAMKLKSYDADAINKVMLEIEKSQSNYNFFWLSANPDQPDNQLVLWMNDSSTIDVLIHYGYFSGRELAKHGVTGLDDHQMYNAAITVIKDRVIQALVERNPTLNLRPIYTASFYKTRDRIPCFGIPQMMRDVERCYQATMRHMMRNGANSVEPITEMLINRVAKFLSDEDLGSISPGAVYMAEEGIAGNNNPALRFYNIPNVQATYMRVLEYFMEMTHYITNLPAQLHGTAVGSGAMRTFRGAAMLQGNAVKSIQEAVGNLDDGWFSPCGELMFNYNMLYEKDESIKGDCLVSSQGVKGMLSKELNRNNAMELIQLVGAVGNQMQNAPEVMSWALNVLFETMDVPEELRMRGGMPVAPSGGGETPAATMAPAGAVPEMTAIGGV